jgi:hypothetical protein
LTHTKKTDFPDETNAYSITSSLSGNVSIQATENFGIVNIACMQRHIDEIRVIITNLYTNPVPLSDGQLYVKEKLRLIALATVELVKQINPLITYYKAEIYKTTKEINELAKHYSYLMRTFYERDTEIKTMNIALSLANDFPNPPAIATYFNSTHTTTDFIDLPIEPVPSNAVIPDSSDVSNSQKTPPLKKQRLSSYS